MSGEGERSDDGGSGEKGSEGLDVVQIPRWDGVSWHFSEDKVEKVMSLVFEIVGEGVVVEDIEEKVRSLCFITLIPLSPTLSFRLSYDVNVKRETEEIRRHTRFGHGGRREKGMVAVVPRISSSPRCVLVHKAKGDCCVLDPCPFNPVLGKIGIEEERSGFVIGGRRVDRGKDEAVKRFGGLKVRMVPNVSFSKLYNPLSGKEEWAVLGKEGHPIFLSTLERIAEKK